MAKILVIEDEQHLREEIVDWLNFEGYEVIGAENGLVGVELLRQHLPDLILSDIMMPYLDGYGVLLEVRSNPATINIPLIFLTAKAAREDFRRGMGLGADDYIAKPFERLELLESIQMRLDRRRMQAIEYENQLETLYKALNEENERRYVETRIVSEFNHDVRNFLAMILSANSLVRDYADRISPDRRVSHLNQIEGSTQQLLLMLDDLYAVTQLENGLFNFTLEPLEWIAFVEKILEECRRHNGRMHQIIFQNEYHADPLIPFDKRLFRLILIPLLSNAVKYSPQNSVIEVTAFNLEGHFGISVTDHGIGIPVEEHNQVFKAFQRASNASQVKGAGLGLLVVRQAVDLHRGYISVKSEVGVGTTVSVTLPLHPDIEKGNTE